MTSGGHQVYPLTPAKAVADYRLRLTSTSALMQVSALGLASITCTAGKPFRSHPIISVYNFVTALLPELLSLLMIPFDMYY